MALPVEALMPYHPAALIFPAMSQDEMDALVEDIRRNGLMEPILTYQGQIVDGRHRYEACQAIGITPDYREYVGPASALLASVIALNLHRRHLTEAQKATIGVEALPLYEAEARQRQTAGVHLGENVPQGRAAEQAAEAVHTNPHYVKDAKRLKDSVPLVYDLMREGLLNIPAAKAVEKITDSATRNTVVDELVAGTLTRHTTNIQRRAKEIRREASREENRRIVAETPALDLIAQEGEQFSCIVLDPPWDWGDEGDVDQFGRARPTYATLPFDQIAELPVPELAEPDCHIYLWITNRSLPKGFALLERWGFRYITALTWVKPYYGQGNYFRGQSEHVLFGVKGSLSLLRQDQGTVFEAPRGKEHSGKPVEFYELVESCSPGPWLELFSRSERHGWKRWGEPL